MVPNGAVTRARVGCRAPSEIRPEEVDRDAHVGFNSPTPWPFVVFHLLDPPQGEIIFVADARTLLQGHVHDLTRLKYLAGYDGNSSCGLVALADMYMYLTFRCVRAYQLGRTPLYVVGLVLVVSLGSVADSDTCLAPPPGTGCAGEGCAEVGLACCRSQLVISARAQHNRRTHLVTGCGIRKNAGPCCAMPFIDTTMSKLFPVRKAQGSQKA